MVHIENITQASVQGKNVYHYCVVVNWDWKPVKAILVPKSVSLLRFLFLLVPRHKRCLIIIIFNLMQKYSNIFSCYLYLT